MNFKCLFVLTLCAHTHSSTVPAIYVDDDEDISASVVATERPDSRNLVVDLIRQIMNGFREVIVNGNEVLPPLDPLTIPMIGPYVYSDTGLRLHGQVNNIILLGMRWYDVDYVTFNSLLLQLGMKITVPWITITGNLEASARVLLIPHTAAANFRVLIHRPEVVVSARLGTNLQGRHLTLRELDINITISNIDIQLVDTNGSPLLNGVISSVVRSVAQSQLRDELEALSRLLSHQLFQVLNDALKEYTLKDLLGL